MPQLPQLPNSAISPSVTHELAELLQQRLNLIADHAFRDRDPAAHLNALAEVSEKISTWTLQHRRELDPRLRHFLANSSFQKALDFIQSAH